MAKKIPKLVTVHRKDGTTFQRTQMVNAVPWQEETKKGSVSSPPVPKPSLKNAKPRSEAPSPHFDHTHERWVGSYTEEDGSRNLEWFEDREDAVRFAREGVAETEQDLNDPDVVYVKIDGREKLRAEPRVDGGYDIYEQGSSSPINDSLRKGQYETIVRTVEANRNR